MHVNALNNDLGESAPPRLRDWLKERGVRISWLAARAGISYPSLRGYLAGLTPMPDDVRGPVVDALCKAFDLRPEQIPN